MTEYDNLIKQADALIEQAELLKAEAHRKRALPDYWRVGMKVRYLRSQEWGFSKGQVGTITEIHKEYQHPTDPNRSARSASEYQVFYTGGCYGQDWTTPDDVELLEASDEQ